MRYSRSILAAAAALTALTAAACGHGATEPEAMTGGSAALRSTAPGIRGGAEMDAIASADNTAAGDSAAIVGTGDGSERGASWGGGQ